MLKTIIYPALLLLLLMNVCACHKNGNGGTFTYKGRWLEDCSGTPVANKSLSVEMYKYGFNNKDRYSGTCITDSNGNFSLELPNHGTADDMRFNGGGIHPGRLYRRGKWRSL